VEEELQWQAARKGLKKILTEMFVRCTITAELPDGLQPYKGRLSERFYEERRKVISFVKEVIIPSTPKYMAQRVELEKGYDSPLDAPEPPIMKELRGEAKNRGVFNFFLPEVCGLTVLEYSPIAEILGAYPLANLAMVRWVFPPSSVPSFFNMCELI